MPDGVTLSAGRDWMHVERSLVGTHVQPWESGMREAGWSGMDTGEARGTELSAGGTRGASQVLERPRRLRIRHWRDHSSGPAAREIPLFVCVPVHEVPWRQEDPGASCWVA